VRTAAGVKQLAPFLEEQLLRGCNNNLTLVLVVTDEGSVGGRILQQCVSQGVPAFLMDCLAFEPEAMVEIFQGLIKNGNIDFDDEILEDLAQRYEKTRDAASPEKRFTLAHIQAVCHMLAGTSRVDFPSYSAAREKILEALHQAINVCEIISFVEDFAWPDAAWLRNIIKVPLRESKERIAEFIKAHHEELVPNASRGGDEGRNRHNGSQKA
jgi:hypothetical protein